MLFVSPIFLFAFLPIILILYYLLKGKRVIQNGLLFLASIIFYAWGEFYHTIILLFSIFFNWLIAMIIGIIRESGNGRSGRERACKALMWFAVIGNVSILFVFKYLEFTIKSINDIAGINIGVVKLALPIGISFFTFQALSYVIDVYRGGVKYQNNLISVGLYISFFPQLIAGPIVRYKTIETQINNRMETFDGFSKGVARFMQGFSKKVLLANTMATIADKAFEMVGKDLTLSFAWLGAFAYTFQIYYDFSGYSDMAIGLGRLFGFEFDENFNHPYSTTTITDFWRRWHISLSSWFRDYVYIPLGGSKTGSKYKDYRNLFLVWMLTGIWHGANWTFIVWGFMYFLLLFMEKATVIGTVFREHKIFGRLYTFLFVMLLWVVFRANNLPEAFEYIKTMLGLNVPSSGIYNGVTYVYLKENVTFLLAAVLFAENFQTASIELLERKKVTHMVKMVSLLTLFIFSIIYMVNDTYNPFIYFNF